jgi:hypothetical protein
MERYELEITAEDIQFLPAKAAGYPRRLLRHSALSGRQ